jgi:hypothetical protein
MPRFIALADSEQGFLSRLTLWLVLPIACLWVKRQESAILRHGVPLTEDLLKDARKLGIQFPERVRLRVVNEVPAMHPLLRFAARRIGLCSPETSGMSLRYGIFVRANFWGDRSLVIHELAHTLQYERMGGIRPFLKQYLYECLVTPGYPFGDLEQEAIQTEEQFRAES